MLALMLVETAKSCRALGDWGHDGLFHLPAVSIIKQQCPLNTVTRLFIGICMSFPRLHDCLHAICISYIKSARKHDSERELGDTREMTLG